jgi:hypothetical protein
MEIKTLFGSDKDIYRTIEKVITYGAAQETRLKSEISEYIVTESIEEQFEGLLSKMQAAMESGGENEVGVWVSGFYGSGKSSFTKYLGLAFDEEVRIDGTPFIQHLQDRLKKSTTKALLNTVAKRFPAAVVMLDLASSQIAGATMEEVSTVLYYKVLQEAGYSRNLKVAALERKLKKESRYDEFLGVFSEETNGEQWTDYRNDDLVIDSLIPAIAHKMYPDLFKTDTSFSTEAGEVIRFEDDRVAEMLEIIRDATGKEYVIFIIDEVGQYVGSRQNLILNLDGLAKNLKNIGDGKVWIIGTAQQTLTEDDKTASLNSPELYKLKDRFPIEVELESKDIREICYSRLLGKSPEGESVLGELFDKHGQELRHNTKLVDARAYGAEFDKKTFVDLYPFLPAHFDILLHLLGALAKTTGGVGLRSAIKVVQDVLIEGPEGMEPVANQDVGWLATTVTLYDALEKDIRRGYQALHQSVGKVAIRFPDSQLHQNIAKTVCVLQILGNLPISRQNVTGLMHGSILKSSAADEIETAVEDLITDSIVPFGEQDGNLRFFSEKLNDIEQERAMIPLRNMEVRRIQSESMRESYAPLPSIQLHGTLSVQTGLKMQQTAGSNPASLSGDRNPIQTIVELADTAQYEAVKSRLIDESRSQNARNTIFLMGYSSPEIEEISGEIYRCKEIVSKYRTEPDQEVKEYCAGQTDRAARLMGDLERILKRSLVKGSFLFRGEVSAVEGFDQDLLSAARKQLSGVAEQVFDRYAEAPKRVGTDIAEKFLRLENLAGITAQIDPLELVQSKSGRPTINTDHKAIVSIRDRIDQQGSIEGKRLIDVFTGAPFGWSPDTLRYIIAAMLVCGEVELKVSGRKIKVGGQQAIDALKTNNAFKTVGVSLRDGVIDMEMLARAAGRLTDLSGENVVPLEGDISKAAMKLFPRLQQDYAPLTEKIRSMKLTGADRLDQLNQELADLMSSDASDAPGKFGGVDSELNDDLMWSQKVKKALEQGLEQTIRDIQAHLACLADLPSSGITGELQGELSEEVASIQELLGTEGFHAQSSQLASNLTHIKARFRDTVIALRDQQQLRLRQAEEELNRLPEWPELNQQEKDGILSDLETMTVEAGEDLIGLKLLVNQQVTIQNRVQDIKTRVQEIGRQRLQDKIRQEQEQPGQRGHRITRQLQSKNRITSLEDLDQFITDLRQIRGELQYAHEFELTINLADGE